MSDVKGRYVVEYKVDAPYPGYSYTSEAVFYFHNGTSQFEAEMLANACRSLPQAKVTLYTEEARVV